MALELGINSYITAEDAATYFENRLGVDAWNEADTVMREQALVMATAALEEMHWKGRVKSDTQPLCWPRVGTIYDPARGTNVVFDDTVPPGITKACCELAYHYLNNPDLFDDTGLVVNLKVDVVGLDKMRAPNKIPCIVKRMISKYLLSGTNSWWRAN